MGQDASYILDLEGKTDQRTISGLGGCYQDNQRIQPMQFAKALKLWTMKNWLQSAENVERFENF